MQVDWLISASGLRFLECFHWSLTDTRIHLVFHILKRLKAVVRLETLGRSMCVLHDGILATNRMTAIHK